jgi:G3E family GTPase
MGPAARDPIPFTVVGGFLGSGKTTLINELLRGSSRRRVAVLVNDFGAINVDARLIESSDGETLELANGCICCSFANGFADALGTVLARAVPPEHIVVEASGIADPWRIAQFGLTPGLALDGIVVLADVETVQARAQERYVSDVVCGQLRAADLVVVNKTDLVGDDVCARTRDWLRDLVPDARIVETTHGAVPPELLLGPGGGATGGATFEGPGTAAGEAADDGSRRTAVHQGVFASTLLTARKPLDRAALGEFLAGLPPEIYRAKGFVDVVDEPGRRTLLQLVGRRWSLSLGAPWRRAPRVSQLVVIGAAAALAADDLVDRFSLCLARALRAGRIREVTA